MEAAIHRLGLAGVVIGLPHPGQPYSGLLVVCSLIVLCVCVCVLAKVLVSM